ncbi:unnamed protein product [Arctia plantaginis]|uniref:Uncharacterized protein n=1 Tax=Arctia plantaginis TaxID=874455 RepID=A0A8S0ZFN4_ARCPL|nr:unnamed protein product [Arctia plantaginis]
MCIFPFILSLVSSLLIIRAAENSCKSNQWQCRDGACISLENVCDAANDCPDDSDETLPFCRRITSGPSTSCILPPYPAHGTYEVEDLPDARPGQSLASFALTVQCRKGYGVMNPNGDGSGIQQVYCVNGKWHQDMPKCVRFCKLDPDPSVHYMCYYPGKGVEVCKHYVPPGMSVEPVCNRPIYYSNELLPNMRCMSGVWNYIALCKAECGRVTPGGLQLAIGATKAKRGELPWHVGIYRKTTNPYTQICGGSLVSNNIVISAAHCFWRDVLLPAADFGVAGGNIYRSWDNEEDVGAQKSDVKEIKIPSLFEGESANFQEDIAVLTLMTPFNFTTYIRPVCLDFGVYFEKLQLQHGKLGKVAGWGLTAAHGQASHILRVLEMPFISVEICISTLPETFREYITGDKFCAGYTNGTALCQGDSGGGLAFSERERGVDRYYLRGIVSAAPNDEDKLCNDNVKEIKIPSLFEGESANFQEDIAVLTLMTPFNFTTYIRPVCLDFGVYFDQLQLQHGKLGKVAGWGLTAAHGQASHILRVVEMPFISVDICIRTLPETFREYITGDKFCAGYTNGTALCQGDSGGGLAFSERERGVDRYYLRGIVSAAPNDEDKLCNDNVYTTFTKITKHQEFIKEAFAASARKTCPLYSFQCDDGSCVDPGADCNGRQDCSDGSDESDELCRVTPSTAAILFPQTTNQAEFNKPVLGSFQNQTISPHNMYHPQDNSTKASIPMSLESHNISENESRCEGGITLPWPVAIFNTTKGDLHFICGGTLLSDRHLITVAHCVFKYKEVITNQIVVKLGLENYEEKYDEYQVARSAVTRKINSMSVPESYKNSSPKDDIAILTLIKKVDFNGHYVNAACLWKENSESTAAFGIYSGWQSTGYQEVRRMFTVNTAICQSHSYQNVNLDKTVCVERLIPLNTARGGLFKPIADQPSYYDRDKKIPIYQPTQNQTFSNQQDRTTETPKPIITQTQERDTFQSNSRCNDTGHGYTIGDFPWPVAIYTILKSTYICGGTLISNKHVITTAHSLPTSVNKIMVKLGLYNAKKISDTIAVTRTVISTSVHPEYNALYSENDIAILKLNETVEFKAYIRAACLWNGYSEVTRVVGDRGYFVGWSGDIGSPERLQMYVVKPDDCRVNNRTLEKTLCTRDFTRALSSGGGFYLSNEGSWRLRGVYSLESKCLGTEPSCTPHLLFIDIALYLPWINSVMSEKLYKPLVDQTTYKEQERNIPIYQLTQNQTLSNQRDRKTKTLKPIITQTPERDTFQSNSRCNDTGHGYTIGDFPWPVAIYTILKSTYICGGTLISNKHVITTAHSLPTSVNKIMVKLGLYNAKKISDTIAVTRTVISTSVHPEYNALYSENDIAILKLNETVEFKAYIRAACLWNGYSEVTRVVGDRGYFVGWSGDIGSPERLQMYVVKPDDCRVNNRTLEKTLCTRDFTRALSSGGGFYLSNEGSWRLRGVYSLESKCLGTEPSCTPHSLFIDIAQYLPWINSVMSENLLFF